MEDVLGESPGAEDGERDRSGVGLVLIESGGNSRLDKSFNTGKKSHLLMKGNSLLNRKSTLFFLAGVS